MSGEIKNKLSYVSVPLAISILRNLTKFVILVLLWFIDTFTIKEAGTPLSLQPVIGNVFKNPTLY